MTNDPKYILVAEDDKAYANVYKTRLAREGFEVEVADDGEKALRAMRERKPDLVVLDLVMPVKDGFAVLKEMKSDPALKNVNVVVASNLSQDLDLKKAKELGAIDYFVKSDVSIGEMIALLKKHL